MANTYDIGDLARLDGAFTDADTGLNVDPTAIVLTVRPPAGAALQTYTYGSSAMVRDAAGLYHYDLNLPTAGVWHYRFTGTGTAVAAGEKFLTVRKAFAL